MSVEFFFQHCNYVVESLQNNWTLTYLHLVRLWKKKNTCGRKSQKEERKIIK